MKLSIPVRLGVLGLLSDYKGSIADVRIVSELNNSVGLSEEDFKKYGVKTTGNVITWDDDKEPLDIEIGDRAKEIIADLLKQKDSTKQLTTRDLKMWDLFVEGEEDES